MQGVQPVRTIFDKEARELNKILSKRLNLQTVNWLNLITVINGPRNCRLLTKCNKLHREFAELKLYTNKNRYVRPAPHC